MATFTIDGHLNLTMSLKVDGRTRWVTFTFPVIYGNRGNSTFTTSDPKLIEALKGHKDFGTLFHLEEGSDVADYTVVATHANERTIEDELKDSATAVYDETVTTKGMAVAYIQGNYDDIFTATTVEDMKREAARKWNVIFKNWGK